MIIGIGTDIVSVARMENSLRRHGFRFAEKLLSKAELDEFHGAANQAAFLAKRFAVKEALVKALGIGFAEGITWKQVSLTHNERGAPGIELANAACDRAELLGVTDYHVSLADEREQAIAFVILEKKPQGET